MKPRATLSGLALLAIFLSPGASAAIPAQDPEPLVIPKVLYLQSVRFAIEQVERDGLSQMHLVLADKERFLTTVDGWLEGVAQDPGYLRHLNLLPWIKSWFKAQSLSMVGFTQPKGWTGFAQALPTPQENAYNGFIILADFQPQKPVTPFHEAIHAFTFAIDGGDIDLDSYGGPEFLSSGYRNLLGRVKEYDSQFCAIIEAFGEGGDPNAQVTTLLQQVGIAERIYRDSTTNRQVEELLTAMGGKADWDGYRTALQDGIAEARAAASAGTHYQHPACRPATDETIALDLTLQLNNARTGSPIRQPVRVRLPGFGQQTTSSGHVSFTLKRADLEQFRDRFSDRITVEARAAEFRDGRLELPIARLIGTLDRGEGSLSEVITMEPAPIRPAMTLKISPPLQTAAKNEAIAWQYQLTNTGDAVLNTITLTDPNCTPADVIAGDINGNDRLDVGESWWLECTGVAHRTYSSTVQARAETSNGKKISATATASLVVNDCPAGQQAMPDIRGLLLADALAALGSIGVDTPLIASVESDDAAPDTILEQQPQPEACIDITSAAIWLTVAEPLALSEPEPAGPLEAELECAEGLEITAGARPSRTCWLAVRNWALADEYVRMAVTLPGGTSLDVWPMNDSAWPPNMHNPGVADLRFKQRYIFTLLFSAPITATPGMVIVGITVSQRGHGRVNLELPVSILPPGRMPSQGSGIRPPVAMADGSGEYCVWRYKAFGDPPNCFLFNIATCGTAAYDGNARYERVGQNMTKLEASVLMSQLSRYGGDAYGCLDALNKPEERSCPDGTMVGADQPCPPSPGPGPEPEPEPEPAPEQQQTCPDGSVIDADQVCPEPDADESGLDCSDYGARAELYWDHDAREYLCRCKPGHAFHVSERCVPDQDLEQCLDYPGTFPYNGVCQCLHADEYWSEVLGRCATIEDWPEPELADCSAWPGTLPLPDPFDGELRCTCPLGTDWSEDLKRCATQAETEVAGTDCSHQPGTVAEMDYYTNTAVCACPGADETWDADAGQCTSAGATGSGSTPVGNDPDPPPPTDVQPGQCNDQTTSGSDEPVRVQIPVSGETGVELTYDTVNVKDRVRAFIDGQLTFDSDCVGTDGDAHQTISLPVGAQVLEIDVYPNCESTNSTSWSFSVDCAGADPNGGQ